MTTKLWTKPQTQQTIKQLRQGGYEVTRDHTGRYSCMFLGKEIFRALPGTRGYLVWHEEGLFEYAT